MVCLFKGGSTLGMSWTHSHAQTFTLLEHAAEQRRLHRHLLAQIRSVTAAPASSSSDSDTDDQRSESELDLDTYYFLQVTTVVLISFKICEHV